VRADADFETTPTTFTDGRGRRHFAFVTFLMLQDSYLPGALVLAHSLRQQGTQADLVCLVTSEISSGARKTLEQVFDVVIPVEGHYFPSAFTDGRPATSFMFTKLHALRLGSDGDLGHHYDGVVLLDADVLPRSHYDHLFTLPTPAGVLNEHKAHLVEPSDRRTPSSNRPMSEQTMSEPTGLLRWKWHDAYDAICPHGHPIPADITDRVKSDPKNMGISGALFVWRPDSAEYQEILEVLRAPDAVASVHKRYPWPDMQFLTGYWSGRWHNVDARFASLNGYPDVDAVFGIHYGGIKPWSIRHKSFLHYARFPDFRLWQAAYLDMVDSHPRLTSDGRLDRLAKRLASLRT
jgi:alpha-N-acetylglucosamine transferase